MSKTKPKNSAGDPSSPPGPLPSPLPSQHPGPTGLGIAAVERETGLSKDLLRMWERRYGFPQPQRSGRGDRLYPVEQVQRLRRIRRALDLGARPHQVVAPDDHALRQFEESSSSSPPEAAAAALTAPHPAPPHNPATGEKPSDAPALDALIDTLLSHRVDHLEAALQAELLQRGLGQHVREVVAPLVQRVGLLWSAGRIQVHEEHLLTEVLQQHLRRALGALPPVAQGQRPRVLLSTVPGEAHALGLLMVQALLQLQGSPCVSLGTQTPVGELLQAAAAQQADVLALSFSAHASPRLVSDSLQALLTALPEGQELWVGGAAAALRKRAVQRLPDPRLRVIAGLDGLAPELARWRQAR